MSIALEKRDKIQKKIRRGARNGDIEQAFLHFDVAEELLSGAVRAKEGYVIDNKPCVVADYRDGSVLACYGVMAAAPVRLLTAGAEKRAALDFLKDSSLGRETDYSEYHRAYYGDGYQMERFDACNTCGWVTRLHKDFGSSAGMTWECDWGSCYYDWLRYAMSQVFGKR